MMAYWLSCSHHSLKISGSTSVKSSSSLPRPSRVDCCEKDVSPRRNRMFCHCFQVFIWRGPQNGLTILCKFIMNIESHFHLTLIYLQIKRIDSIQNIHNKWQIILLYIFIYKTLINCIQTRYIKARKHINHIKLYHYVKSSWFTCIQNVYILFKENVPKRR